jgi:hypothetical protein
MKKANGLVILIILSFCFAVWYGLALWTDNNLEFWLSYAKGRYVDVNNWLSLLLTLALNGVALIANVISEIVKLVVS